jgi:hypothetical protein
MITITLILKMIFLLRQTREKKKKIKKKNIHLFYFRLNGKVVGSFERTLVLLVFC